jgi:hypothetical protein
MASAATANASIVSAAGIVLRSTPAPTTAAVETKGVLRNLSRARIGHHPLQLVPLKRGNAAEVAISGDSSGSDFSCGGMRQTFYP